MRQKQFVKQVHVALTEEDLKSLQDIKDSTHLSNDCDVLRIALREKAEEMEVSA